MSLYRSSLLAAASALATLCLAVSPAALADRASDDTIRVVVTIDGETHDVVLGEDSLTIDGKPVDGVDVDIDLEIDEADVEEIRNVVREVLETVEVEIDGVDATIDIQIETSDVED